MWLTAPVQRPGWVAGARIAAKAARMRAVWLLALILFLVPGWSGVPRLDLLGPDAVVTAKRVPLDRSDPKRRRVGALTYLGGVELDSPDPVFGGFSSMHVAGDRFTLLDDGGNIVGFRMGADWRPRAASFAALPDGPGRGWEKGDRDSESLAVSPDGRHAWVGFERFNQIWRYSGDLARVEGKVRPRPMQRWSTNSGAEAMARLSDGSFLVLAEEAGPRGKPGTAGLWFAGDPIVARRGFAFRFVPPPGYWPTDMIELPNRNLLVLVRAIDWRGFKTRLLVVRRAAIRPEAVVRGREVARFERPLQSDNFEALALTREGGRTILWIASDDNVSFWQRSLLLKFALPD